MPAFLLGWFRLIWLFTRGHQTLALENLALRQQLAVYKRYRKRPKFKPHRPVVLDRAGECLEGLATSLAPRAPRHGRSLAAKAFP